MLLPSTFEKKQRYLVVQQEFISIYLHQQSKALSCNNNIIINSFKAQFQTAQCAMQLWNNTSAKILHAYMKLYNIQIYMKAKLSNRNLYAQHYAELYKMRIRHNKQYPLLQTSNYNFFYKLITNLLNGTFSNSSRQFEKPVNSLCCLMTPGLSKDVQCRV